MSPEIRLFACLCLDQRLVASDILRQVAEELGPDADLGSYAQHLIDSGACSDWHQLEAIANEAFERGQRGELPPYDPFVQRRTLSLAKAKGESEAAPASGPMPRLPSPGGEVPATNPVPPSAVPAASVAHHPQTPAPEQPQKMNLAARGHGGAVREPLSDVREAIAIEVEPGLPDFHQLGQLDDAALGRALVGLLREATRTGISDLHLCAGSRPFVRRHRRLEYLKGPVLDAATSRRLNTCLLNPTERDFFLQRQDFDLALGFTSGERYRVNLMVHKDGVAGTYRTINDKIPSLESLGYSAEQAAVVRKLLTYHNGLILVTGPVGAGKTTTLATLVDEINRTREDHIITVEQPIEFVHRSDKCSLTQRGVGSHTHTFHSALKGALRQDPDIIVIGEMRDLETIEMAISASETGHLVIGTLHTFDAATTLNRILDVFPPAQQGQIRAMVAESLRGIICQRLIPDSKGGLALALELMVRTLGIANLIREGKTEGLGNLIETGKRDGMVRMENSVMYLWREGRIDGKTAIGYLQNRANIQEVQATLRN